MKNFLVEFEKISGEENEFWIIFAFSLEEAKRIMSRTSSRNFKIVEIRMKYFWVEFDEVPFRGETDTFVVRATDSVKATLHVSSVFRNCIFTIREIEVDDTYQLFILHNLNYIDNIAAIFKETDFEDP